MQSVQPIFSFFWVLGRGGKGEFFSFFYWGWGSRHPPMEWRRQSCGNLSHSKEVVARSDQPQVIPSSVVFYFIFLRFFVCSHSGDLPLKNVVTFLKKIVPKLVIKPEMK